MSEVTMEKGVMGTTFLYLIINYLYAGFAITILWGYFIVPLGVPEITLPHAIGIYSILYILTKTTVKNDKKHLTMKDLHKAFINSLVYITLPLIVGFVSHYLM